MNARFVIVNEFDRPSERMVAEWIDGIGYCYLNRELSKYDGMRPSNPTPVQDFGVAAVIKDGVAHFSQIRHSLATYRDGRTRQWQGVEQFTHKLIDPKKVGAA